MEPIDEVNSKIDHHIDICAMRYEGLDVQIRGVNARLKRMEQIFIASAGAIILLLAHLAFK